MRGIYRGQVSICKLFVVQLTRTFEVLVHCLVEQFILLLSTRRQTVAVKLLIYSDREKLNYLDTEKQTGNI